MSVYYNEIDPRAAAWLRELIRRKAIADGEVDTRSIVDVQPADLAGFRQCHFFAGIGGWSYALRLAGWPDDREVWTGSCPCQPWSVAGASEGTADPRHLWPAWFRLIAERRPAAIFGEQVASSDGLYWLDLVFADLEAGDYAIGAFDLPAACVGAPHGRQRLWFVADHDSGRREGEPPARLHGHGESRDDALRRGTHGDMADTRRERRQQNAGGPSRDETPDGRTGRHAREPHGDHVVTGDGADGSAMGDAGRIGGGRRQSLERPDSDDSAERIEAPDRPRGSSGDVMADPNSRRQQKLNERERLVSESHTDGREPRRSFWSGCDWIPCLDGKARPVEPGSFPLAHGVSARVGRLRGYGNAIVPQVAAEVIRAYMEVRS